MWPRDEPRRDGVSPSENEGYRLRWFTPTARSRCVGTRPRERDVLWRKSPPAGRQARFHTPERPLTADRRDDWIELDFPATPPAPDAHPRPRRRAPRRDPLGGPIQVRLSRELDSEDAVPTQPDWWRSSVAPRGISSRAAPRHWRSHSQNGDVTRLSSIPIATRCGYRTPSRRRCVPGRGGMATAWPDDGLGDVHVPRR